MGTGRFELPTCRLGGGRSIQLSYVPTLFHCIVCRPLAANVFAVVHAFEVDLGDGGVGVVDAGWRSEPGGYAQNASAGGDQACRRPRVPAWKTSASVTCRRSRGLVFRLKGPG